MSKNFHKKNKLSKRRSGVAAAAIRSIKQFLFMVATFGLGSWGFIVRAADPSTEFDVSDEFKQAVTQIYNVAIGLIIIAAVLMIIVGGYTLVFSAGKPDLVTKGKKQISGAIIGLVLAILSAVFLNFLNPRIFQ